MVDEIGFDSDGQGRHRGPLDDDGIGGEERPSSDQLFLNQSGTVHAPYFVAGDYRVTHGAPTRTPKLDPRELVGVPLPPSPAFVGRNDLVEGLVESLTGPSSRVQMLVLTGLGGVGKTEIALELASRAGNYRKVFWIDASTHASAVQQFVALSRLLGGDEHADVDASIESTKQGLARLGSYLLIFDKAPQVDVIRSLLPTSPGGDVLVTSLDPNWHELGTVIEVEPLSTQAATELLSVGLREFGLWSDSAAIEVVNLLGCLPLALVQARSYCAQSGQTLQALRDMLLADSPKAWTLPASTRSESSIGTVWRLSIEASTSKNRGSSGLLQLLSFVRPVGLDLAEIRRIWPDVERRVINNSRAGEADAAISHLRQFSLVYFRRNRVAIHPLLAAYVRQHTPWSDKRSTLSFLLKRSSRELGAAPWRSADWSRELDAADEILMISHLMKRYQVRLKGAPSAFDKAALFFSYWWLHEESVELHESVVELGEAKPKTILRLAHSLRLAGRTEEARIRFSELLEHRPKKGSNPRARISALELYVQYATTLAVLGKPKQALDWFDVALVEAEHVYGRPSTEVAKISGRLGGALRRQGEFDRAIAVLQVAIQDLDQLRHVDTLQLARTLGTLGRCYTESGDGAAAIPLADEAVRIKRSLVRQGVALDHPSQKDLAQSLLGLGAAYARIGLSADCRTALGEVEAIFGASYGPDAAEHCQIEVVRAHLAHTLGDPQQTLLHVETASRLARRRPGRFEQELQVAERILLH